MPPHLRSFRLICAPSQREMVEALLQAEGYVFAPEPFSPWCRVLLEEPQPLGSSLAAFFGYIYIQDRSSMLPPLALLGAEGGQGQAVLDMCASPGSKTGFVAQLTGNGGFVLGNEPSRTRLATLRENLHALGLVHAGTCHHEGQTLPLIPESWQRIQLDPPCSGWGTEEKHPQVRALWHGDKVRPLITLQRQLLAHATRLLAPGGVVVYSTCTTNEAENEAQVRYATQELGLVCESLPAFAGFCWEQPAAGAAGTLRVDGARSKAQGFYIARLRKPYGGDAGTAGTESYAAHPGVSAGAMGAPDTGEQHADGHNADGRNAGEQDAYVHNAYSQRSKYGKGRGRNSRHGASPSSFSDALEIPRQLLEDVCADPALLPAGRVMVYGTTARFIPQAATDLLTPQLHWQAAPLGRYSGGRVHLSPRSRALMPEQPPADALVLDSVTDVRALLQGRRVDTALSGRDTGLYWQNLPLGRVGLKQGRAVWSGKNL